MAIPIDMVQHYLIVIFCLDYLTQSKHWQEYLNKIEQRKSLPCCTMSFFSHKLNIASINVTSLSTTSPLDSHQITCICKIYNDSSSITSNKEMSSLFHFVEFSTHEYTLFANFSTNKYFGIFFEASEVASVSR